MPKKYIDANAALKKLSEEIERTGKYTSYECGLDDAYFYVDHIPAADVVEVVRCKDCSNSDDTPGGRFCKYGVCVECKVEDDFFCRDGERKEKIDDNKRGT